MSQEFVATIVMASTLWVYWDATRQGIGRVPGSNAWFNLSAGAWATFTLLFWIVGFFLYLLQRPALLRRAAEHPVRATHRPLKFALLALAGIALMGLAISTTPPPPNGGGGAAPGSAAGTSGPFDPD